MAFSGLGPRSNNKKKEGGRIALFFWSTQNPMKMKTQPVGIFAGPQVL
jgi:hypothetical protein